ncbi:reverse transcriptase [Gossypium australe]|uniref:Reverse transcriptase n=1 Tax=Gossypium australe TaxID=47621 RepID=A0A5B6VB74_9ROSI|nr:reverse transcriptase [Gossypium australe]
MLFCKASRDQVVVSVGFDRIDDLGCYLGMPLFHNRVTVHTFDFIVSKVRQKLSGWDARKLSLAGQIILVRLVLLAIPNYFMFTIRVPLFLCNEIERLARNFIWGTTNNKRKIALLS